MFKLIASVFLVSYTASAKVDSECLNWFQKAKLKSTDKGCILSCNALLTDFNTFYCPNQCEELCEKVNQCNVELFWKDKLKSGRPTEWDLESEKSSEWTQDEKEKLLSILGRLPDEMKKVPFDGFYRMQKSIILTNPASTSESGKAIVIYDRTFKNPFWTADDVILHEFGHVVYLSLKETERHSYRNQLGWKRSRSGFTSRNGEFISGRAKDSPDEDFAENFSFFLKDPNLLKAKSAKGYDWFVKKYSTNFKFKKVCQNEKE